MIAELNHADFPADALRAAKDRTVSVVVPARDCADTVGVVVERIAALGDLVDEVLVVDGASADATAEAAAAAGARVVDERVLAPEFGPVEGKGDALWRSLAAATGDVLAFVDGDTEDFSATLVTGLIGPLLTMPGVRFVKAAYRRPFRAGEHEVPDGGGRVSQLLARPLLDAFYPELSALTQPLAGEVAATRELLDAIPFATGYGVEIRMLLDVLDVAGADAMAQCHVGERRNRHQPLDALRPMADTVLAVVCERLRSQGRLAVEAAGPELVVRPPFATLAAR